MKAHVKNIIGGVALGLALLAPTIPLWAGYTNSPPYEVFVGSFHASGALPAARYSTDTTQYIGCRGSGSAAVSDMLCFARNKNGATLICGTYDARLISAARAITGSSSIFFDAVPGTSTCNSIVVEDASFNLR
jgi:hypothetical protein